MPPKRQKTKSNDDDEKEDPNPSMEAAQIDAVATALSELKSTAKPGFLMYSHGTG